jgi:hypothetical protein
MDAPVLPKTCPQALPCRPCATPTSPFSSGFRCRPLTATRRVPPFQGGAPLRRPWPEFAGTSCATSRQQMSVRPSMEVLFRVRQDNISVRFAGLSSPLTDSNRRPPPYHEREEGAGACGFAARGAASALSLSGASRRVLHGRATLVRPATAQASGRLRRRLLLSVAMGACIVGIVG